MHARQRERQQEPDRLQDLNYNLFFIAGAMVTVLLYQNKEGQYFPFMHHSIFYINCSLSSTSSTPLSSLAFALFYPGTVPSLTHLHLSSIFSLLQTFNLSLQRPLKSLSPCFHTPPPPTPLQTRLHNLSPVA